MLHWLRNIAVLALALAAVGCGSSVSELGPTQGSELTEEEKQKRDDEFRRYREQMKKHMPVPQGSKPGGYPGN